MLPVFFFGQQAGFNHVTENQYCGRLRYAQFSLYILASDVALLLGELENTLLPVGLALNLCGKFLPFTCVIAVGQGDLECVVRNLELGFYSTVGRTFVDLQNTGTVCLDQLQAVKYIR